MNIAFITPTFYIAPAGGIKLQALMWKQGLEKFGHQVTLIDSWKGYVWTDFDLFFIFGYGGNLKAIVEALSKITDNIVLAPIIDTNYSVSLFRMAAKYLKCSTLRLHSVYNDLYEVRHKIRLFYVRSAYEMKYLTDGLGISDNKIIVLPLSCRIKVPVKMPPKESFCFHVSLLVNPGKNVKRLIEAAVKYNFKLVLAGTLRNKEEEHLLLSWIRNHENIKYVGFLSEDELLVYYLRAKVFALPSTYEGVGMVALEAAACGCNIVLTKNGGPKEYYDNHVYLVNPYDVDEIGTAVVHAMNNNDYQPCLMEHIKRNYSFEICSQKLNATITNIKQTCIES